ncbi:hypothetical protein F1559_001217 [Cyanidiococcus yangmingshanensis]|uniref:UBR-type domain-containing protein n=1 Tax=Cyanidiococcus yangmingshanensis TaxID=2690220 RepID=A0A7J7IH04_9RHOD|nr:hypothetical protein F1559_001217 [Cyanidiococcus yangmingshanensis]
MLKAWLERACQLELTHWTQDEQTDTLTDTRRVHDVYRRFLFFYFATIAALSASRGVLANMVAVEPVRTALMARLVALSRRTTDLVTSVSTSSSSSALAASEAERFTDTLECLVRERLAVLGLGACLSLLELGDAWITPLMALLLEQLHAGYLELGQMPATAVAFQKSSLQAHWLDTLCTWILVICREPDECTLSPTDAERMSAERQTSWTRSPDPWKREENELSTDCLTCSFQRTGRQFQAQHWYRCATCSFADDEGICTACALVCHAGHEVSYARFSGFFCDCGAASTNSMVVCCRLRTTEATRKQASCSASSQITPSQHDDDLEKRTEGVLLGQAESEGSLLEALQEPAHDLFAFMARFPVAMEHLWESWASAYLAKISIPSVDSAEHVPSITAPWMERIRDQLMWLRQEALHPSFYIGSMWKGSESPMVPETDDTIRSDMSSSTAAEAQASIPTATETGRAPPDPTEHNAVPIRNASGAILYKRLEWAPCTTQMLTRVRHLDQVQGIPRLGMDMCLDSTTKAGNSEDTKRLGASIDPSLVFADGLVMVVVPGLDTHGHQVTGLDLANVTGTERTGRSFTNEEAVARAASEGVSSATRTTNTSSPSSAWLSPALDTRSWERLPLGIGAGTIRFSGTWRRPGKPQRLLVMNHESSTLRLFSRNCPALSAQMHLRNTLQANQRFIWSIDAERIASATTVETAGRKTSDTQARQASSPCISGPSSDEALAAAAVSLQHWRHTSEAHDVPYLLLPLHRMVTITAFTPTSDGVGYASGPLGATSPPPGPMSFENTAFVESTTRMNRGSTGATPARLPSASTGASTSPSETENRAHNANTQRAWTQHLLLERKALDNGQAIGEASWLDAYADDWLLLLGQDRDRIEVCSLSYVCTCWICRLIRAVHGDHDNEPNPLFPVLGEPFSSSSSSAEQTEATPTPATRTEYLEWVCWDAADTAIDATTGAARVQDDGSVSPLDAWVASSSSTNDDSAMASPLVHHDQQVFETTREMGVEPCWAPDASKEHDPWRMTWQRRFVLDWNPRACLEAAHSTQSTASRVSASTELANSLGDLTAHVHAPLQAWTHGRVVLDARDVSLSPPGRLLLFLMLANNHLLVYGYVAAPWTTITSGSPTEDAVLLASMQLAAPSRALTAPAAPIEQGTGEVPSVASETGTQVTGLYYDDTAQVLDLFWSNGYWNRWRVRWLANNVRDGCSEENTLDRHPMHEDEQTPFWSWSARQLLLEPVAEEPLFRVDAASTIRLQSVQQMPVLSSGHRSYATGSTIVLAVVAQSTRTVYGMATQDQLEHAT